MFSSILTVYFDLILGSFLLLGAQWAISVVRVGYNPVISELLFSMFSSILTFDFDLIMG